MGAEAGWDWFEILGAAGALAGVVAIFLHYADKPEQIEAWVDKDPEYRAEFAAKLRDAGLGATYRDFLTRGLDWLDRKWGDARSTRALGICIVIGLCYAYGAFFLAWGVGAPGSIAGGVGLVTETPQPARGLWALLFVAAPPLGFTFGRFLGWQDRRLKLRLRRHGRWRQWRFELGYRAALGILFGTTVAVLSTIEVSFAGPASDGALMSIGPIAGILAAQRIPWNFLAGPLAAFAGPAAVAVVVAFILIIPGISAAGAFFIGGAVCGAFAGAAALAAAVALAVAEAFADTADVLAGAVPFVYTFVGERGDYEVYSVHFSTFGLVVAVAGAIGAAAARRSHQGIFAGGIGCLIAYGIFGIDLVAPMVVIHLIFFLVLPIVNGLWDWLSWWITRALGRHLLGSFGDAGGLGQRAVAVVAHGALDLILAVALLAAMAFFLAFGFEAYNRIAIAQRGEDLPVFALGPFLAAAADHPWTDGLWLTVMLISTLVPTALHVVALLASPIARRASSAGPGATSHASGTRPWHWPPGFSSC